MLPAQRAAMAASWAGEDTHTTFKADSSSKTPGCRLEKMFPDMFLQGAGRGCRELDSGPSWIRGGEGGQREGGD